MSAAIDAGIGSATSLLAAGVTIGAAGAVIGAVDRMSQNTQSQQMPKQRRQRMHKMKRPSTKPMSLTKRAHSGHKMSPFFTSIKRNSKPKRRQYSG
jgi:hypothetical protein